MGLYVLYVLQITSTSVDKEVATMVEENSCNLTAFAKTGG
jgi:hypothetical protein